jgi:hypothetical protein
MSKLFTFAGTCVVKGATVYKFANDANRAAVLTKLGATDVNIIALPYAMDKEAAVDYLGTQGITAGKMPRVAKTTTVAKSAIKTKLPKVKTFATPVDELSKEAYAESVERWKANDLPIMSYSEYKRCTIAAQKFFARCDARLDAKRAVGRAVI